MEVKPSNHPGGCAMKVFWLVMLFCLIAIAPGQTTPTPTVRRAGDADEWWKEAQARGKKVAKLKQARYDATKKLEVKLHRKAEREVAKGSLKTHYEWYVELRQKAAAEFAAIQSKYDPQITEAMNQYIAFLREGEQNDTQIMAATASLKPEILYKERANYTEDARQHRAEGTVLLSAIFTADGRVTHIRVVRGLPDGLNDEALKAIQEIVFLPARKNGYPVSVRMSVEYSFHIL
jgi:TonB family protein